jgi:hypothetical protein
MLMYFDMFQFKQRETGTWRKPLYLVEVRGALVALRQPRGRDVPTGRALREGAANETLTQLAEMCIACICCSAAVVMAKKYSNGEWHA